MPRPLDPAFGAAGVRARPASPACLSSGDRSLSTDQDRASGYPTRRAAAWAEVFAASAIVGTAIAVPHIVVLGPAPWLMALAAVSLWWRGPGWAAIGVRRPTSSTIRTVTLGIAVGIVYQFVGLYAIEPLLARVSSGALPDVSQFRSLIGNLPELAYWLTLSWTLAALLEELSFRGWLLTRAAEAGDYSPTAWVLGALGTSALFGVAHAYQGLSGMLATGLTGLVFAGLYLFTNRNVWACVVAHGALDTTGFVMMYFGVYPGL